ncbi:MAG: FliA/WhiG family RNA polymerase sigma factor [Planctomycetes bacterium]|nr:FliA/WhiG family RNA polymerase sigma factor [Planctomycetota bacterium]
MQKSDALQAMWREYKRTSSVTLRNQIVEAYLPLVDYLSERIAERLPRCVGVDEVRSAGVLGLMDAVEGFDLERGIKFETYCSVRVRGSILDELRSRDWVPRLVRSRAQKFALAVRRLQGTLGRKPTPPEVMSDLGLKAEEYEELQRDLARLAIYSLSQTDDNDEDGHGGARSSTLVDRRHPDPVDMLQKREATGVILRDVDEKERQILALYYFECLTMKEIGRRLSLSESRVCQIHGEVIQRLRDALASKSEELSS